MPIRTSEKHGGKRTALCINCENEVLSMPNARFTLQAEADVGEIGEEGGYINVVVAHCNSCGYMELYHEGYLFKFDKGDA